MFGHSVIHWHSSLGFVSSFVLRPSSFLFGPSLPPANDLPAINGALSRPYDESDFLADWTSAYCGRFGHWWVANPWFDTLAPGQTQDMKAATKYWHQDVDPPVFDATRACKPGVEFLRTISFVKLPWRDAIGAARRTLRLYPCLRLRRSCAPAMRGFASSVDANGGGVRVALVSMQADVLLIF